MQSEGSPSEVWMSADQSGGRRGPVEVILRYTRRVDIIIFIIIIGPVRQTGQGHQRRGISAGRQCIDMNRQIPAHFSFLLHSQIS